jgi:hypothetical protein
MNYTPFNTKGLALCCLLFTCSFCSHAEQQVYTFDVCGAAHSYKPGWMPNGDPRVNGEMTLIIDSAKGLLTLKPS